MRILLSNDDGIYAAGIFELYKALRGLGQIDIVAPDAERSAVGHAITLSDPIKTKRVRRSDDFEGFAVGGTPADCVKLAVCALLDKRPDVVISGINLGPNAGISLIYSGTVSAATEGTILGIPSMAVSIATFRDPLWDTAAQVARRLAEKLGKHGLPEGTLLNVNVPNVPFDQLRGFAVTRMARSRYVEIFDKRSDPRGNIYYWMDGEIETLGDREGTDLQALEDGYVSLTPIWFDLTCREALDHLKGWDLKLEI